MCFYFTLKFRIYWDLFSLFVGIKTCLSWICYECVQFQIDIRKLSRCGSSSPNNAEFGHFTTVLQRTAKKCTKNYNARAQLLFYSLNLLFCDVLVAVAFAFCVRSLLLDEVMAKRMQHVGFNTWAREVWVQNLPRILRKQTRTILICQKNCGRSIGCEEVFSRSFSACNVGRRG